MDTITVKERFGEVYKKINGYQISHEAQGRLNHYYDAHIYGEVLFDSFAEILGNANPQEGEIFYDLGCGTGRAVAIAALLFPFSRCIGVEKLEGLYKTSVDASQKLKLTNTEFIHRNFNDVNFSNGNILYLNSYYFYYEMYSSLSFRRRISLLQKGSRIITVKVPYINTELEIIHEETYEFSWGNAQVYISRKI